MLKTNILNRISIIKFMLFIFVAFNLSCNSNRIYHEKYTFSNYQWSAKKTLLFYPELKAEDIDKEYKLEINIRYIQGFPYKYLNLLLKINRPDGSEATKEISMQIVTDDKQYRGDGAGDIWDLDYALNEPIAFDQTGKYTIEIISMMKENPVNFINEIGISIIKDEKNN